MEKEFLVPFATLSSTPKILVGGSSSNIANGSFNFPTEFWFRPSDEELIRYLHVVNLYKYSPWELSVMFEGVGEKEKEWYFFMPRDWKYLNGQRPNRAAGSGVWKATGADDKPIKNEQEVVVGYRKALVFYEGKPPGMKNNWMMHEYRVSYNDMRLDDWVLCRIYQKGAGKSAADQPVLEPFLPVDMGSLHITDNDDDSNQEFIME